MNEQTVAGERNVHGHAAHSLVSWNLAVIGGGFAYFSYIDAPITDAAMWMFAVAVAISLLSLIFALASASCQRARPRRACPPHRVAAVRRRPGVAVADRDTDDEPEGHGDRR